MSHKRASEAHHPRDRPLRALEVAGQGGLTKLQASAVLAVGLAFCLGVTYHWGFLNGFTRLTHYEWPWHELGILKTAALLAAPFAVIVWVLWRIEKKKSPTYPWVLLELLALSNFLLQTLGMLADPRGIQLVREIVASPKATSYFTDAMAIQRPLEWLAIFITPTWAYTPQLILRARYFSTTFSSSCSVPRPGRCLAAALSAC